ncbi:MAG: APH(3') family aminoglycoside O-phosphotransferase, partial [Ktedonobacteraceae bacterium]
GGTWQAISMGCSGNQVFHIARPNAPACYLKIATDPSQRELVTAEKERLDWLQERLPVPSIYAFHSDSAHTYLLTSEIPGLMACDPAFAQDIPTMVYLLAEGLRHIHQVDITYCPFDQRLTSEIAYIQQRVAAGLVDTANFNDQHKGMSAAELFKLLIESQPPTEDIVFTHGDYCLPNVLIDQPHRRINGFIDWGRAGIADRYQDLVAAARSLTRNFGPGWEPLLWEMYGLEALDTAKYEFYQLLDMFY